MSARPCFSLRSHATRPVLPSPISLPASSVLDLSGYLGGRRRRSVHRDFRSQRHATFRAFLLRWGRCGGAQMNRNQSFVRAISFEDTTEGKSRFNLSMWEGPQVPDLRAALPHYLF